MSVYHRPMTARLEIVGPGAAPADRAAPAFASVEAHRTLADVEPVWRDLLTNALATPYQTPGFLGAWLDHVAPQDGVRPLIVVARDAAGLPVALLPLGVTRRFGVVVARFFGSSHVNFNMPVFRRDRLARFTPGETERLMREIARVSGIDVFALSNQPHVWDRTPNPFAALPSRPAPDPAFSGPLAATIEEHLQLYASAKTRSAQRRKIRRFEEHGTVRLYRAATRDEREKVLEAFFRQKAQRLGAKGIGNVFERPGVRGFIRGAAGVDGEPAAIDLYGFDLGDHTIATFGAISNDARMSGMFNSITSCELARYSPGELLLNFMVEDAIARGMSSFDLGVGVAPYKALHCPNAELLFDSVFGVTALGRASARAVAAKRRLKSSIKANPTAYGLIVKLRKLRATDAAPED